MMKTEKFIAGLALVIALVGGIIAITSTTEDLSATGMTVSEGKEIATTLNHYIWPDGTIIHKELDNGWVCVEIDKHHLLVYTGGKSGFGVAVDSCIVE